MNDAVDKRLSPTSLRGEIALPGDKSISHRAILFSSFATGTARVLTSVLGRDNFASLRIMRQLGVKASGTLSARMRMLAIDEGLDCFSESAGENCEIIIEGLGLHGFSKADSALDCGNSGTSARLLCGLLAGQAFESKLVGDHSLQSRPFKRVTEPLGLMGARFSGDRLPLTVAGPEGDGNKLRGINYDSPRASAQVKSALLLAGLQAEGEVRISESHCSRDHTERMLQAMGCELESSKRVDGRWEVVLTDSAKRREYNALDIEIPSDFSAAAFFLVAGSIVPGSEIMMRNVGFNQTRIGLFSILERMGASFTCENARLVGGEEVVDILVRSAELRGVSVTAEDVVLAIDEIPILAVAAAFAEGETHISGAAELRVKESDRLTMTAKILNYFGVPVEELPDGLRIQGQSFTPTSAIRDVDDSWKSTGDHRIAMSGAVLQYALGGDFELHDKEAVETSFPTFIECFEGLGGK
jgi:3-phosphoshikimate 1-carboxyvinyltransferase